MSKNRHFKFVFPAAGTQDVCSRQTLAGAGNLILNGTLSNIANTEVNFIQYGYTRQLSLSSDQNLGAVNFTVTGYQNGLQISEVITGPNPNTVYSTQYYDTVVSVTASTAAVNISVGSGHSGFFKLIGIQPANPVSVRAVILNPDTTISYTVYASNNYLSRTHQTYRTMVGAPNIYAVEALASNLTAGLTPVAINVPFSEFLVKLAGSADTINHTATLIFTQFVEIQ